MKPQLTVLMAVYNGGDYLKSSIKSILDQTYKDFELLIVNDCSTDDTVKLIESFADERIRLHHNQMNMGQTKSLNEGLRLAKYDWVARMDADDIALEHWLECQADFIEAHPDYAVVSCDAIIIDRKGHIKSRYPVPSEMDDIILRSFFKSPVNHVGSVINRKGALALGGYDEQYRTVADYDLWKKMILNHERLSSSGQTCLAIRRHEESFSFTDLGADYFRQIAQITSPIIAAYSSCAQSQEKLIYLLRSLYTPRGMSEAEFEASEQYLHDIYEHIETEKFVEPAKIKAWSKKFGRELILKRIQAQIEEKNYPALRKAAKLGMRRNGSLSIFTLFYILSPLGSIVLKFVPKFYYTILKLKTLLSARQETLNRFKKISISG